MINHPHYMKRYVHIRAGELKIVSHNRYFVINHGVSGGIVLEDLTKVQLPLSIMTDERKQQEKNTILHVLTCNVLGCNCT